MAHVRDALLEEQWFEQLRRQAAEQGVAGGFVTESAARRLELGARTYGDDDFVTKDVLAEAHDEAADLVAYALLETHKRNAAGEGGHHHLQRAAFYAILADAELRASRAPQ